MQGTTSSATIYFAPPDAWAHKTQGTLLRLFVFQCSAPSGSPCRIVKVNDGPEHYLWDELTGVTPGNNQWVEIDISGELKYPLTKVDITGYPGGTQADISSSEGALVAGDAQRHL